MAARRPPLASCGVGDNDETTSQPSWPFVRVIRDDHVVAFALQLVCGFRWYVRRSKQKNNVIACFMLTEDRFQEVGPNLTLARNQQKGIVEQLCLPIQELEMRGW